jgi:L-iditol 2-dehydrogenase
MQAVVKAQRGAGFVELREVELAAPGPKQVQVEVRAAGICGSDLHIYHDTINYNIRTPVVMGHEFSGVVVAKGDDVGDEVSIGDRVTGEPSIVICGRCDFCRSGHYNMCPTRQVMGYYHDGCFAPRVNATFVHRLPDNVSFEAGAVTELLACCVHSVIEQCGVVAGDTVAVIGPGPVGLFSALVAMAEGGSVVLCGTGRDRERLAFAERELGVAHTLDVEAVDAPARLRELTGGYGADVVVECAGVAPAIDLALEGVRKRGRVSLMGLPGKRVEVDIEKIAYKELVVSGGIGQRRTAWERSLALMERGVIDNARLISHELPLGDWHRGFEMMEKQEGIKLLLKPGTP